MYIFSHHPLFHSIGMNAVQSTNIQMSTDRNLIQPEAQDRNPGLAQDYRVKFKHNILYIYIKTYINTSLQDFKQAHEKYNYATLAQI